MLTDEGVLRLLSWLGFPLVETPAGPAIKMLCSEAFELSSVTGAVFLDSEIWPFSPRGFAKIFNRALSEDPVWGLFDNGLIANGPWDLEKDRPFLFSGEKYVLVRSCSSESDYIETCQHLRRILPEPEHFLLVRLEAWKRGLGLEPLLEFLGGRVLSANGYFVESQVPLSARDGSPDLAAFRLDGLKASIERSARLLPTSGHLFNFLLLDRLGPEFEEVLTHRVDALIKEKIQTPSSKTIVCEAKTGAENYADRLSKYLNTGFFEDALGLVDNRANDRDSCAWKLGFDENGVVFSICPSKEPRAVGDPNLIQRYEVWIERMCGCYFLAGLRPDIREKLFEVVQPELLGSKGPSSFEFLYGLAKTHTISDLVAMTLS
jgi:hypothetical protein